MKLFVGLGNPGAKYAANRHNIGFMALDRIAQDQGFGPWKRAFQGQVSEGRLAGEKVLLLKPETFMNLSGQSVQAVVQFHKIDLADVTVFHDELDLPPAKIKYKMGGGHAGHNGLRSIHAHLGEGYGRVRLGIGHPGHKDRVADYVLHDFAKADQDWIEGLMSGISDGLAELARGDGARFLNAVALRMAPPKDKPIAAPKAAVEKTVVEKVAVEKLAVEKVAVEKVAVEDAKPIDTRSALERLKDRFRP